MRARSTLIIVALCTAACSRQASEPVTQPEAQGGSNALAAVEALSPGQQRGVLFRAIRDAQLPCQRITDTTRLPDQEGRGVWRARCEDGSEHLVAIDRSGTAAVLGPRGE